MTTLPIVSENYKLSVNLLFHFPDCNFLFTEHGSPNIHWVGSMHMMCIITYFWLHWEICMQFSRSFSLKWKCTHPVASGHGTLQYTVTDDVHQVVRHTLSSWTCPLPVGSTCHCLLYVMFTSGPGLFTVIKVFFPLQFER